MVYYNLFWSRAKISHDKTNTHETPKSKTIAPSYQKKKKKTIASHPILSLISMLRLWCAFSFVSAPNNELGLKEQNQDTVDVLF
ncbi:hypothetical protein ACB092_11G125400 [Castanea dentata]